MSLCALLRVRAFFIITSARQAHVLSLAHPPSAPLRPPHRLFPRVRRLSEESAHGRRGRPKVTLMQLAALALIRRANQVRTRQAGTNGTLRVLRLVDFFKAAANTSRTLTSTIIANECLPAIAHALRQRVATMLAQSVTPDSTESTLRQWAGHEFDASILDLVDQGAQAAAARALVGVCLRVCTAAPSRVIAVIPSRSLLRIFTSRVRRAAAA